MEKLTREFYERDAECVAHDLIGKILVHDSNEGRTSGVIIETEAYKGPEDKAAHSYGGRRTSRTEAMYLTGGHAYIYLIYGMHYCFNVTANFAGKPEAVLVRALDPLDGLDLMASRKKSHDKRNLCNGPGKLCCAMGITRELYGEDLCGGELYILDNEAPEEILTSPRINIDYAEEYRDVLWRYYVKRQPVRDSTDRRENS